MRTGAPRKRAVLEAYLADFSVLHSDSLDVLNVGRRSEREHAKGTTISSADAWIAASALVLSSPLVTNNPKDYRQLDNLQIVSAAIG